MPKKKEYYYRYVNWSKSKDEIIAILDQRDIRNADLLYYDTCADEYINDSLLRYYYPDLDA